MHYSLVVKTGDISFLYILYRASSYPQIKVNALLESSIKNVAGLNIALIKQFFGQLSHKKLHSLCLLFPLLKKPRLDPHQSLN